MLHTVVLYIFYSLDVLFCDLIYFFRFSSSTCSTLFWSMWTILTVIVVFYISIVLLTLYSTQMKMEIIFSNRCKFL